MGNPIISWRIPQRAMALLLGGLLALAALHGVPTVLAADGADDLIFVEYDELAEHVGIEIVVETSHKTQRRGILRKQTRYNLTLELASGDNTFDLTIPRETVQRVALVASSIPVQISVQEIPRGQTN